MKIGFISLLMLMVSACGQKTPEKVPAVVAQNLEVFESRDIVISLNNETETEVINFNTFFNSSSTKTTRLQINNATAGNITINNLKTLIEAWDDSTAKPNSVTTKNDTCSNKLLRKVPNNPNSCYIDIDVVYNEGLDNNVFTLPLIGSNVLTAPTVQLVMDVSESYLASEAILSLGSSFVKSTEILNFGTLMPGSSSLKRLYISNINSVPVAAPILPSLPAGVSVTRNTCSGNVAKVSSCFIDFKYDHQPSSLNQEISFSSSQMNDNQKTLQLVATNIQESVPAGSPKLSLIYTEFPENTTTGTIYVRRLFLTNNSQTLSYQINNGVTSGLINHPTLVVLRNTCDGLSIRPGNSCYVDIQHQPLTDKQYVKIDFDIPGALLSEDVEIGELSAVACSVVDAQANGVQLASVKLPYEEQTSGDRLGDDITACILKDTACDVNYEIAPDKKSCTPVTAACTLADAQSVSWNISNALTAGGNKVGNDATACSVATCNNFYDLDSLNKTCKAQERICLPADALANGVNQSEVLTYKGNVIAGSTSQCLVNTCNPNFEKAVNEKSCTPIVAACTLADAQSVSWNITNALTAGGSKVGNNSASCVIATCSNFYDVDAGTKSCKAQERACLAADAVANGVNTLEAISYKGQVVAGNTTQCLINECSSNFDKAANEKSCTPKTVACTLADAQSVSWNINNALTPGGNKVGNDASACVISTCSPTYSVDIVSKSCKISDRACVMADAVANGVSTSEVLTYKGTVVSGSVEQCLINTCTANFEKSANEKTCTPKTVACTLPEAQSAGWIITNAATAGGNKVGNSVSACVVQNCNSGYFVNSSLKTCSPDVITYQPQYSSYGACSAAQPCAGIGSESRTITSCQKYRNGVPEAGGIVSNCSSFAIPANLTRTCNSPAGQISVSITNGSKLVTCAAGSTTQVINSVTCDQYYSNQSNQCLLSVQSAKYYDNLITTLPTMGPYSPDGVAVVTGDKVLFDKIGVGNNNKIYQATVTTTVVSGFRSQDNFYYQDSKLSSDGKIYVVGGFTTIQGTSISGVARLNADGNRDPSFNVVASNFQRGASGLVISVDIQSDQKTVIGGTFSSYNADPVNGGNTFRSNILRLNTNGAPDTTFNQAYCATSGNNPCGIYGSGNGARVGKVKVQPDQKILVHAYRINTLAPIMYNGSEVTELFRLNSSGLIDSSFTMGTMQLNSNILDIAASASKIFVGGYFSEYSGIPSNNFAALLPSGAIDSSFDLGVGFNGIVRAIVIQPDGKILVGGHFTTYKGIAVNKIVRLTVDGNIDPGFTPDAFSNNVSAITLDSLGKIFIGGDSGAFRKLNANGTTDSSFALTGLFQSNQIRNIHINTDGSLIVTGYFNTLNGVVTGNAVKLNANGSRWSVTASNSESIAWTGVHTAATNEAVYIQNGNTFYNEFMKYNGLNWILQ